MRTTNINNSSSMAQWLINNNNWQSQLTTGAKKTVEPSHFKWSMVQIQRFNLSAIEAEARQVMVLWKKPLAHLPSPSSNPVLSSSPSSQFQLDVHHPGWLGFGNGLAG